MTAADIAGIIILAAAAGVVVLIQWREIRRLRHANANLQRRLSVHEARWKP